MTDHELCAAIAHADCSENDDGVIGACDCPCHELWCAVEAALH